MCATELQNVPSASNPPAFGMVLFYAIYYYSVLNSVSTIKKSVLNSVYQQCLYNKK